jgi:predicted RNA-binding protein with EMAP domain
MSPLALHGIALLAPIFIGAVTIPQILRMTRSMIRGLKRRDIIKVYGEAVNTSTYLEGKERYSGLDPDEAEQLARTKAAKDKLKAVLETIDEEKGLGEYGDKKRTARIRGQKISNKRK